MPLCSRSIAYVVGALVCFTLAFPSARADNLDDELLVQAPALIKALQSRGYQSVGVLSFQFKRGNQPSQPSGAVLCTNLPQRLESALALKLSSKLPQLTLARSAASSSARASYRTAEERQPVFKLTFPRAWGDGEAFTPECFLTGTVELSDDLKKLTVSISQFNLEKIEAVLSFSVSTDRYLLADAGQGFSLTKARATKADDAALLDAVQGDIARTRNLIRVYEPVAAKTPNPVLLPDPAPQPNPAVKIPPVKTPPAGEPPASLGFPVKLTVYYDDVAKPMELDADAPNSNNLALPEPKPGQSLTFGMVNQSQKPLGAVLLVNGISTLYEQEGLPSDLSKWVLEPGKEYRIKGYHQQDNARFLAITTLTEEQSRENFERLGGVKFAGLIHLYVFTPLEGELVAAPPFTRSLGRFSRADASRQFASLLELQQSIARKSSLFPPGTRPLAGWGKESTETLEEKKLGVSRLTDTMVIRYSKFKM